ncbi:MAG: VOC family protein [Elusimicrobia bacterium]|nr:VOC family protein [Elusimicrobiota bacterium]
MPKHIPAGYHSVTPVLVLKDAKKAIAFYKKAFGARETLLLPAPNGGVMHAEIRIGDSAIMLGEENAAWKHKSAESFGGSPVSLALYVEDADASYRQAVAAGAQEVTAPEDSFWGDRCGTVRDPFGYSWSIAARKKDLSPEQMLKAGQEWLAHSAPR